MGLATTALVSGGLGWAGLELAAGSAHAGSFHWCPGDPPPKAAVPNPNGPGFVLAPINPAWDTTVCHDYVISGARFRREMPVGSLSFSGFSVRPARPLCRKCRSSRISNVMGATPAGFEFVGTGKLGRPPAENRFLPVSGNRRHVSANLQPNRS